MVMVMAWSSVVARRDLKKTKDPRRPARVRRNSVVVELVALAPPCSSVSPGAGNEPKKAIKPRKRAKKGEEGYVAKAARIDRNMDTPAIGRDQHGDGASVSTIQPAQLDLHENTGHGRTRSVPAV